MAKKGSLYIRMKALKKDKSKEAQSTEHRAQSREQRAQSAGHRAQGTGHRVKK